jgi:hypothetical protein
MFPGIAAADCATTGDFTHLFEAAMDRAGPSFIALDLNEVEVPPFAAFQERAPDVKVVEREVDHG